MGHLFQTQVPRDEQEWMTALKIQESFPNSMGVIFPIMVIATAPPQTLSNATQPRSLIAPTANHAVESSTGSHASSQPIDVRRQQFFDVNCRMINTLISGTKNTIYHFAGRELCELDNSREKSRWDRKVHGLLEGKDDRRQLVGIACIPEAHLGAC
eukprot:CAMPEP_0115541378 /NCGR_PEP_ID=MMETSP0271-20121206/90433_1 /TAXON_ID=71861 /ORGANISM="Scrippsiella trochoidea, Strain CCMP3099" /LENGTH=155 /DNA_ID=CAMNT_0002974443 /DNA_START=130 /DNA_END=597 /DNA_ORIENTATION=-